MSECDKCREHAAEHGFRKNIFFQPTDNSIDVYITMSEFHKLNRFVDFLPTYLYPSSEPTACRELGKIEIIGGPILRFHQKRCEIPIETCEELERHRPPKE